MVNDHADDAGGEGAGNRNQTPAAETRRDRGLPAAQRHLHTISPTVQLFLMNQTPPFDLAAAHKWFSADCFNRVWTLLEQPQRTTEEDESMISLCHASIAHWNERPDRGHREISVGWWQLSRVYGVLGQAQNARHYASLSLAAAVDEPPFYAGYAHEALARAARAAGDDSTMNEHLEKARSLAAQVENAEERQWLETDLVSLQG
jgi:hypothetical protein